MLLHQRNQTDVAARTQQPSASYLGRLVAIKAMMVIASSTVPNQSHCCWASGSSSFISLFRRFPFLLRFFFLRPYRVRGALNERLDLHYVLLFQLAGEIRHAVVAERAVEDEVFQVRNRLGRDIAEVLDVAALVDAWHAMAEHAVADIKQRAGLYVGGIVLHTFEQARHLVLGEVWWRRLATDGEGEDRSRPFHVGRPSGLSKDTAPPDRNRDILYAIDGVGCGSGDDTSAGWRLPQLLT